MSRIDVELIEEATKEPPAPKDPVSECFLANVQTAISELDYAHRRKPSSTYKPSSLHCKRAMYYMRRECKRDESLESYKSIGMADTGTYRHTAIQTVLENMYGMGYEWEYLDVGRYVENKHKKGKILGTNVTDYRGHECHLLNDAYHVSFMCDGILYNTRLKDYYLFEFKNQMSFKAQQRNAIDPSHILQITAYCTFLDLDKVIMLYENRDTCQLKCPPVYSVSQKEKEVLLARINEVELHVLNGVTPEAEKNVKWCQYCPYKSTCDLEGDENPRLLPLQE